MFIIDVGEHIIKLIDHFESEDPRIFERHELIADFLVTFLGKFLVNGGGLTDEGAGDLKIADIMKLKYRDRKLQLSNKDIFLGSKADQFIAEIGFQN